MIWVRWGLLRAVDGGKWQRRRVYSLTFVISCANNTTEYQIFNTAASCLRQLTWVFAYASSQQRWEWWMRMDDLPCIPIVATRKFLFLDPATYYNRNRMDDPGQHCGVITKNVLEPEPDQSKQTGRILHQTTVRNRTHSRPFRADPASTQQDRSDGTYSFYFVLFCVT